ncbi:MAG: penicillin acylase family protein [Pseudomonadota bacterium]
MQKLLIRILAACFGLAMLAVVAGWLLLRASLPVLDGRVHARGIEALVSVERDAGGAVTVSGGQRADIAYGLGYAHGQDRFFQMDLTRRAAAGELSALLGSALLATDREMRVHRFRSVARAVIGRASAEQRTLIDAYAAGVNAGMVSLRGSPFEYLLLGTSPEPWRAEDSVLVVLAMFLQLQEPDGQTRIERGLMQEFLPPAAAQFIAAAASEWDAALDGSASAPARPPSAVDYDLARLGALDFAPPARHAGPHPAPGSNNWAVAGSRTASGAALVANDMHLTIRVPNTWYRARLHWRDASGVEADVTGVTLPGAPTVVAGSNGHVAWGFTNSYGDFQDVVVVVADPTVTDHYLAADGSHSFSHALERILVKGGEPVEFDVVGTQWGPVIGHDAHGRALVLAWTAHDPAAINFELAGLDRAASVEEALALAGRAGMPAQNFVVGDRDGHIGWTVAGQIPTRVGADTGLPHLSTDPRAGFAGWLLPAEHPRVVDPLPGQIQTANARVVGGAALAAIGDGGYDRGARAQQIQGDLAARGNHLTPADMLAVQLDDRALFLTRWHGLLADLLDAAAVAGHPRRAELKAALAAWSGHAAIDDPAYRLVRAFRLELERHAYYALIAPARAANPAVHFHIPASFEGPLWALVSDRPANLLPPGQSDWRSFLLAAVDATLVDLETDCATLAACSWGRVNLVRIRHPLSGAVPGMARLLDLPVEMLPGDEDMPRVQGVNFGASERFAVSPGHEAEALFAMPGGQSGHPLSPYFRAGHEHWAHGTPAPFLPGPAEHRLTLTP